MRMAWWLPLLFLPFQVWSALQCNTIEEVVKLPCASEVKKVFDKIYPYGSDSLSRAPVYNNFYKADAGPDSRFIVLQSELLGFNVKFEAELKSCTFKKLSFSSKREISAFKYTLEAEKFTMNSLFDLEIDPKTCKIKTFLFNQRPVDAKLCQGRDFPLEWDLEFLNRVCDKMFGQSIHPNLVREYAIHRMDRKEALKRIERIEKQRFDEECLIDKEVYGKLEASGLEVSDLMLVLSSLHDPGKEGKVKDKEKDDNSYEESLRKLENLSLEALIFIARLDPRPEFRNLAVDVLGERVVKLAYKIPRPTVEEVGTLFEKIADYMEDESKDHTDQIKRLFFHLIHGVSSDILNLRPDLLRRIGNATLKYEKIHVDESYKGSYLMFLKAIDRQRVKIANPIEKERWEENEEKHLEVLENTLKKSSSFLDKIFYVNEVSNEKYYSNDLPRHEMALRVLESMDSDPQLDFFQMRKTEFKDLTEKLKSKIEKLRKK